MASAASVSSSSVDEAKRSVSVSKSLASGDSTDCNASGPVTLESQGDAGDLTYNTLPSSASQMLLKPTDHIRRLSRVFVNFFQSLPAYDAVLCQRLQDAWSEFSQKYPFFFSIVHRKFKLENDFSFRIHTRTLFAFELPPDTALRMHVDLKKAKSLFGEEMHAQRFEHIFQNPRILDLTKGEGDYIEMAEARELVKMVCDAVCPVQPGTQDTTPSMPFQDNIPMFTLHVVFCSPGAGARSRCRHSMIQLLRREFISMLASILVSCAHPDRVDDIQTEALEAGIARCWDSDVIEKQSQQESLWMKISLRLYNLIGTLANVGKCNDQRVALILKLWKQADQNAEVQLDKAKDVQRKRRRSIEDRTGSTVTGDIALDEMQGNSKASLLRQGLEGNGIGPLTLGGASMGNSLGMLPVLPMGNSLGMMPVLPNQLQQQMQLHGMLQLQQQLQSVAAVKPGSLQALQFMQQQQMMQQQLLNHHMSQQNMSHMNPLAMAGLIGNLFPLPSNFPLNHNKVSLISSSIGGAGSFPAPSQIWSGVAMRDSFPSANVMVPPANAASNSLNVPFACMSAPKGFPIMSVQPTENPWMGNPQLMMQMLGGLHNHTAAADASSNFAASTGARDVNSLKSSASQNSESVNNIDSVSGLKKRATASEPNGVKPVAVNER